MKLDFTNRSKDRWDEEELGPTQSVTASEHLHLQAIWGSTWSEQKGLETREP